MNCVVCKHGPILELAAVTGKDIETGQRHTVARWCHECGSLHQPTGAAAMAPKLFVSDHDYVMVGFTAAYGVAYRVGIDVLKVIDTAPDQLDPIMQYITRRFREDQGKENLGARYEEMIREVIGRLHRLGKRGVL